MQKILKNEETNTTKKDIELDTSKLTDANRNKTVFDPIDKILNLEEMKYYSDEKLVKFSNGYENNNYLMLAILHDKFDIFKYLIRERNMDLRFKNSNGWNIMHFIIHYKRISKFLLLFVIFSHNLI